MFDVQHRDERLPVKAWAMGVAIGGQSIRIQFDRQARGAEALDASGRMLPTVTAFWFAWVAFHPGTDLPREP